MKSFKFIVCSFVFLSVQFLSCPLKAEFGSAGGSTVGISHAGVNMRDTGVNTNFDRGIDNNEFISIKDDGVQNINNDTYNLFKDGNTKTLSADKPEPINPYKVMSIDDQNKRKTAVISYQDTASQPVIKSVSITKIDRSSGAFSIADDDNDDAQDDADLDEDDEPETYEEAEQDYEEALQLAQKRYDDAMDVANSYYGVDNKAYDNSVAAADAEYKNAVEEAERIFNERKIALVGPDAVPNVDDGFVDTTSTASANNTVQVAVPLNQNVNPEAKTIYNDENVKQVYAEFSSALSPSNLNPPAAVDSSLKLNSSNIDNVSVSDAFIQDLLNNPQFKSAMSGYNKPNIIVISTPAPAVPAPQQQPKNNLAGVGLGLAAAGVPYNNQSPKPPVSGIAAIGAGIASFNKSSNRISVENQIILDKLKKSIGYSKNRLPNDEEFKILIDENPRNPVLFEVLALISRNKGLSVSAVGFWNRAIDMNPKNMDYYYERAVTFNHLNDYKQAVYDLDHIIDIGCGYQKNYEDYFECKVPDAYQMKIDIYTDLKDFFKVDEVYTDIIEKSDDNNKPSAYYNRAVFRASIKNYNDAISDLELAIQFIRNRIAKIDGVVPADANSDDNPEYADLLSKKEELQGEMDSYQSDIDMYKGELKTFQNKNI